MTARSPRPSRIGLIGFMGSGKTRVGAALARRLGWKFLDLDAEIRRRAGASIADLFAVRGEEWFRELESACLRDAAARERVVIATGGGVPLQEANRWFFRHAGTIVFYLHVTLEQALARTRGDASRPLLAGGPDAVRRLYDSRLPRYEELGTRVDTDGKSPESIAGEIADQLFGRPS